ncbi:PREDICTED: LRR receptor-like serine/threonine-protein kinase GSO1 isoform X3 [Populus euphratica]|uniref:LRR receptor-like serine/threonine-protein kinase GSO1 isoform X3 n=1 Tax=Populus euphratica TaxID=75702 RepID=A0AAJ6TV64_POPEU|nr:PREDICTED: LRR receptor-like serine/threonine-protein kinase GSO1 isoform X3 [Populus euphratica]
MTSLKTLKLEDCSLNGQLPTTQGLCDLNHLQGLYMSDNDLSGFLPPCVANLTSLQRLDLSSNHLKIPISLSPLYNLSSLKSFYGSGNEIFAEKDDYKLSPKFQLESLLLSCRGQAVGAFPKFLYHQVNLQYVDLANLGLKGEFPNWLIENNTYLQYLFLENCSLSGPFLLPRNSHVNLSFLSISKNHFRGQIPSKIGVYLPRLNVLDMSNNGFNGSIPSSLGNMSLLYKLDLSNNVLIGRIPEYLTRSCSLLETLMLSNNSLQGQIFSENINLKFLRWLQLDSNQFDGIPDSLSNCSYLTMLDVSNNHLSQMIPGWIGKMSSLEFLDLSRNNLSGPLPPSFDTSSMLQFIYLSRNKLLGPILRPFYNYSKLLALDLSHNDLTGRVPEWIGRLSNLRFLLLSYNNLEGEIPIQLCKLDQLTLIDLSHNYLSGNILSCIVSTAFFPSSTDAYAPESSQQSFEFTTKNVSLPYRGSILHYFTGIDFSCNNFSGKIPPEIGNLSKIKALNLSHNNLVGPIPPTFSRLKEIESLDLSHNKLEGEIPPQLTELYYLAVFSVAHNNLSGKTPARVAQFATYEESCYKDNPFLCGQPLSKVCDAAMTPLPMPTLTTNKDNSGFMDMEVFYVTFGVAYIMALLVIGAVLYINPYWRRVWFPFIEVSINNCYYFLVDNLPILSKFGFS